MSVPDFFFGRVRAAGFRAVATVLAGWRVALVTFAGFRRGPPDLFPAAVFLAFDFAFLAVDLAVFSWRLLISGAAQRVAGPAQSAATKDLAQGRSFRRNSSRPYLQACR